MLRQAFAGESSLDSLRLARDKLRAKGQWAGRQHQDGHVTKIHDANYNLYAAVNRSESVSHADVGLEGCGNVSGYSRHALNTELAEARETGQHRDAGVGETRT